MNNEQLCFEKTNKDDIIVARLNFNYRLSIDDLNDISVESQELARKQLFENIAVLEEQLPDIILNYEISNNKKINTHSLYAENIGLPAIKDKMNNYIQEAIFHYNKTTDKYFVINLSICLISVENATNNSPYFTFIYTYLAALTSPFDDAGKAEHIHYHDTNTLLLDTTGTIIKTFSKQK